jgi:hypothetical protein
MATDTQPVHGEYQKKRVAADQIGTHRVVFRYVMKDEKEGIWIDSRERKSRERRRKESGKPVGGRGDEMAFATPLPSPHAAGFFGTLTFRRYRGIQCGTFTVESPASSLGGGGLWLGATCHYLALLHISHGGSLGQV